MNSNHIFKAKVHWQLDPLVERNNRKTHAVTLEGKPILTVSAAKAFKGNHELYNPEDLLLSSLVSCHMMSYLYVCDKNHIKVLNYSDNAEGILEVSPDGSGRFIQIRLHPKVTIENADKLALALELHKKANQLCFIANSLNVEILHFPSCSLV